MAPQSTTSTSPSDAPKKVKEVPYPSSCGLKYPPHRDDPRLWADLWLQDRQITDGAEGLWRVHNKLYDLSSWVDRHPGGRDWIRLTKGTDITEQFESHHISPEAEKILPKFYIRDTQTPRNSPFTFEEDGFYITLKNRVREEIKTFPETTITSSMIMTDLLMVGFISTAILTSVFSSLLIGILSGIFLNMTAIAAHNFFHQKDNFRMYYFDFIFLSHRDWRISHAMSHHLFPNTVLDLEVSLLQPFLLYLPSENTFWQRIFSCIISPVFWTFIIIGNVTKKYANICMGVVKDVNIIAELLPYSTFVIMYFSGGHSFLWTLFLWLWVICVASFNFGFFGLNAAHHHPELFHDGDTPRSNRDWGLFQLDAVADRSEIHGNSFLVLITFGDHVLHHLFPTLDHSKLHRLYPILYQTLGEFGLEYKMGTQWDLVKGQYAQLLRTEKNPHEPGTKWNWEKTFWTTQKETFWKNVKGIVKKNENL